MIITLAPAVIAFWLAGKVRGCWFARIYALVVQLAGAYSVSFVIDMVRLSFVGELQVNAVIYPALTWGFLGGAAFVAAKRAYSSALFLASPYAVIAFLSGLAGTIHIENFVTAFFVLVFGVIVYGLAARAAKATTGSGSRVADGG